MTNFLTRLFGRTKPEPMKQDDKKDETKKPVTIALESKGTAKVEPENSHLANIHTDTREVEEVVVDKTPPPPSNDYFAQLHEIKKPEVAETNSTEEVETKTTEEVNETPSTQGAEEEPTEEVPQ